MQCWRLNFNSTHHLEWASKPTCLAKLRCPPSLSPQKILRSDVQTIYFFGIQKIKEYHQYLSVNNFPTNEDRTWQIGKWSMICTHPWMLSHLLGRVLVSNTVQCNKYDIMLYKYYWPLYCKLLEYSRISCVIRFSYMQLVVVVVSSVGTNCFEELC